MTVGLATTWPSVADAASGKLTGHLVVAFEAFGGPPTTDSYVAVDPSNGSTRSLGISAGLDAGFNTKLTKAAVVRILTSNGQEPETSSLSIVPLGKGRSTTLWTFNSGEVYGQPQWSPNGSQIAMVLSVAITPGDTPSTSHPVRAGLWVINVGNHSRRLLVAGEGLGQLAWSPNGQTLAYLAGHSGSSAIDTISVRGRARPKTIATLSDQAHDRLPAQTALSWSPDGKTLVVCNVMNLTGGWTSSEVDIYAATGGPPTRILAPVSLPTMAYQGAAYSPTAKSVAVAFFHKPPPAPMAPNVTHPAVSTPGSRLPVFSTEIQILNITGRSPHTSHSLAALNEGDFRLVGWYSG